MAYKFIKQKITIFCFLLFHCNALGRPCPSRSPRWIGLIWLLWPEVGLVPAPVPVPVRERLQAPQRPAAGPAPDLHRRLT